MKKKNRVVKIVLIVFAIYFVIAFVTSFSKDCLLTACPIPGQTNNERAPAPIERPETLPFLPCVPAKTGVVIPKIPKMNNADKNFFILTPLIKNRGDGIRTHGGIAPTQPFQDCTINRSDTPLWLILLYLLKYFCKVNSNFSYSKISEIIL